MNNKPETIYDELKWRDLIFQSTPSDALIARLNKGPLVLYAGFDPTAESLHVGNLVPLIALRRFQTKGHQPIALVGGATGLIGDPSGKEAERTLNSAQVVTEWCSRIRAQLECFLDFKTAKNPAVLLNNYEWISRLSIIEYLRDVGKNFSVNSMIARESVKNRLEREDIGISYTEFSYMILQAYDFLVLAQNYNCELQIGGSDQWGNMAAGMDLIRRKSGKETHVITFPLITTASGKKFGKTEEGTIWLDPQKCAPYDFYQFWLNTDDRDVLQFIKYFTFIEKEEVDGLTEKLRISPEKREPHRRLAEEMTSLVHGKTEADKATLASKALFGQEDIRKLDETTIESVCRSTPIITIPASETIPPLVDLIVQAGLSPSKSRARQELSSGGIYTNNERILDISFTPCKEDFLYNRYLVLRRGKKTFRIIKIVH